MRKDETITSGAVLFQICQLCEVREHTGWEGRDGVGVHGTEWMWVLGNVLLVWKICQLCETSECSGFERGDGVGTESA